jgi:hypothetical protein
LEAVTSLALLLELPPFPRAPSNVSTTRLLRQFSITGARVRLSPRASREVEKELNEPAADTPERRYTFARLLELAAKLKKQNYSLKGDQPGTPAPTVR